MVPRPPEWSSRAALRVIDEREKRNRSKKKKVVHNETVESSLMPNSRGLGDDGYYTGFRNDYWSPYECAFIVHKTKYALTVGVGKLFGRYTLLVYRHPWMETYMLSYYYLALVLVVRNSTMLLLQFIIFPAAICLLLGVGFLFRKVVTDNEKQYALPKSTSRDDAQKYTETFKDSLIRTEMIYVTASSSTNLLTPDFLNSLWNFHTSILDLEVTASLGDTQKASSAFSTDSSQQQISETDASEQQRPPRVLSDQVRLPSSNSFVTAPPVPSSSVLAGSASPPLSLLPPRSAHVSPCSFIHSSYSGSTRASSPLSSPFQPASCALTAAADSPQGTIAEHSGAHQILEATTPAGAVTRQLGAAWPQTFGNSRSGRIFGNRWWRGGEGLPPTVGGPPPAPSAPILQNFFPFRPPVGGPPPAVAPPPLAPGEEPSPSPPRGEEILPPPPCDEARAHPKDRISGLACRPPVKSGHYAFSNLCWKDAAGICTPPDGVVFMYNHRGEFGQVLGYPRHTNWVLATEAPTDIWLSKKGLQLAAAGSQAQGTEGFALRYLLSDDPVQRPAAIQWEYALMRHIESADGRLPGASIYVKTEQSLADDLSSSTDPTGHEDLIYVLIAAALIFIYIGFATFSTNRYRSKMLVSLVGGLAAALAYCGGAGLCYLVGVEHTTTVTAAPFLVLGIGVDDVFVIINSYALTYTRASARERLRITMRDSGTSITVTTLTNLISFTIGSTSPYLAIKNFCVITAAGLFAGYLMCITFFVGCLTIDARYEEKKRLDEVCTCLLPICFRRNREDEHGEMSGGPSPARASHFVGSRALAAISREKEASSSRNHSRDNRKEIKIRRGTHTSSAVHSKRTSRQTVTEAERHRKLNSARQSLLNKHATTVYECVTLQVAMAVTKGKVGKKRPSRGTPLSGDRRKKSPSGTPKKRSSRGRSLEERQKQARSYQPGGEVRHPYGAGGTSHSVSQVAQARCRHQHGQSSTVSRDTHRTDITSQDAPVDSRIEEIHSAAQQRGLSDGSFDGDLVLTHKIPLRTSSKLMLTEEHPNRKRKQRSSNQKGIHSVLRGKISTRDGQINKHNNIRHEKRPAIGWGVKKKSNGAVRDQRAGGKHLAANGQLRERGEGRVRQAHGHEISNEFDFACAPGIYTYSHQRRQSDAARASPSARRQPYAMEAARSGAHQADRRHARQQGLSLQSCGLPGTYGYDDGDHRYSQSRSRPKQVSSRESREMMSLCQEGERSTDEALKSHSQEQTDLYYSYKYGRKGDARRRYSCGRQANHVRNRQHQRMTRPVRRTRKILHKRRNQQDVRQRRRPDRLNHNFVRGSIARRRRVSYKLESLDESANIVAQHDATLAEKFRIYPHWRRHHESQQGGCREVMQSGNLPTTQKDQEPGGLERDNAAVHGGAMKVYERSFEGDLLSDFEKKPRFQRPRRRELPSGRVAADIAAHQEAAASPEEERVRKAESAFGDRHENPAGNGPRRANLSRGNSEHQAQAAYSRDYVTKESRSRKGKHVSRSGRHTPSTSPNISPAQLECMNKNACFSYVDAGEQAAAKPRKPSLLRYAVGRKSNKFQRIKNTRVPQKGCQDPAAFDDHGNAKLRGSSRNSLPAQEEPDGQHHELLRILRPEDLEEPPGNVGRRWRLLVLYHIGRLFITPVVKLVVLLAFAALFAVAVIGCTRLKGGLDPRLFSKDGSSLKKFFDAQAKYFSTYGDPVDIFFLKPDQPCSLKFKSEYAWFHKLLESRQYTKLLVDGLDTYFRSPLGALSPSDNPAACMQMLRSWLQTPIGSNFAWQFTWQNNSELPAFQIQLVPQYYSGSQELSDFMTSLRADLQKFKSAKVHAYNKHFIFYESDSNVVASTISNMAWAALAVTMVSLVLLPSLWSAAMVIFILILIDVSIVGFMYYWDLPLNMLTMVNLIISIGFSIDYASHMCHTFSHCVGRTRDLRVFETLVLIGNPIFHGVMSTQLGVLVLAYTRSYVLKVFFKMMTLVLTLAFAHGAILLPVLLSLIGPMGSSKESLNTALKNFRRGLTLKRILLKKNTV